MNKITKITIALMGLLLFSCSPESITNNSESDLNSNSMFAKTSSISKSWDFNNLNEWTDASQNSSPNYFLENGNLNMFTHANTWERVKIKSTSSYGDGTYSWNVFIPELGIGDMTSIGAFIYYDDTHELDFEVGYGSQAIRQNLGAQDDDLVVYMSSQANPSQSVRKTIKRNQWYTFTLELSTSSNGKYFANWKINDITLASAQLNYGNKKFKIFCSVENLQFMGDHIPQNQNYALFNSVQYSSF